jgi:transcriptional regulator with XRE-family HTH domain
MKLSEQIKVLCVRKNISLAELARLTGQSPQNLSSKLKRESFTVSDLEKIAAAVGVEYEHKFVLENGERI